MTELDDVGRPKGGARELLLAAGEALKPAREIRYLKPGAFVDVTGDELEAGARALYALSYSCQQGARALERELRVRCVLCRAHEQVAGSDLCEACLETAEHLGEETGS